MKFTLKIKWIKIAYIALKIMYILCLNIVFLCVNMLLFPIYIEYFLTICNIIIILFIYIINKLSWSIIIIILLNSIVIMQSTYNIRLRPYLLEYLIPYIKIRWKFRATIFNYIRKDLKMLPYIYYWPYQKIKYINKRIFLFYIIICMLIYTLFFFVIIKNNHSLYLSGVLLLTLILLSYITIMYYYSYTTITKRIDNNTNAVVLLVPVHKFKNFKILYLIKKKCYMLYFILFLLLVIFNINVLFDIIYNIIGEFYSWEHVILREKFFDKYLNCNIYTFELISKINISIETLMKILSLLNSKKTVLKSKDYKPVINENMWNIFKSIKKELKEEYIRGIRLILYQKFEKIFDIVMESALDGKFNFLALLQIFEKILFKDVEEIKSYKGMHTSIIKLESKILLPVTYNTLINKKRPYFKERINKMNHLKKKNVKNFFYKKKRSRKRLRNYNYGKKRFALNFKKRKFYTNLKYIKQRYIGTTIESRPNIEHNMYYLKKSKSNVRKMSNNLNLIYAMELKQFYAENIPIRINFSYDILNYKRYVTNRNIIRLRKNKFKKNYRKNKIKKLKYNITSGIIQIDPFSRMNELYNAYMDFYIKDPSLQFWIKNNFVYELIHFKKVIKMQYLKTWKKKTCNLVQIMWYLYGIVDITSYKNANNYALLYSNIRMQIRVEKSSIFFNNKHIKFNIYKTVNLNKNIWKYRLMHNYMNIKKYIRQDTFPYCKFKELHNKADSKEEIEYVVDEVNKDKTKKKKSTYIESFILNLKKEKGHMLNGLNNKIIDWNYVAISKFNDNFLLINVINNFKKKNNKWYNKIFYSSAYKGRWRGLTKKPKKQKIILKEKQKNKIKKVKEV